MKKQNFIFVCSFFMGVAINILGLALVYLLVDRFHFNPGQIGIFMALGHFFYFLGCNLSHRLNSVFGTLKLITVSASVVFLVSIPLCHINSIAVVYAAYWMLQLGGGLYWPTVMDWLTAGLDRNEMNRIIGIFNRSWMLGNILGPLVAGPLYQWNTVVCFLTVNFFYFLVPLCLFLAKRYSPDEREALPAGEPLSETNKPLPEGPQPGVPVSAAPASGMTDPALSKTTDRTFDLYRYRGWLSGLCSAIFLGVIINIIPLYIRDSLGYTERSAGFVLFVRCVAGFAGFGLVARFTRWHFNRRWFLVLQAALILSAFLCLAAGERLFLYFAVAVLHGFLNSACYTNSIFYSGTTGKNPKKNLAFHEIFLCIGGALGSAGGGVFYQYFGFTGTCAALILALCAGLGLLIILDRREYLPAG